MLEGGKKIYNFNVKTSSHFFKCMITHFDVDSDGGVAKLYTAVGSSGVPESDAKEKKRAKKKS